MDIEGYNFTESLYQSSRTTVYRALRLVDNVPVILKILKPSYPSPSETARFKKEYELINNLDLEGVVKSYGLLPLPGLEGEGVVLVLEDFRGQSLESHLKKGKLKLNEFLPIAIQLARTLSQLHEKNIVHGDIKPGNILIRDEDGVIKITDFGISYTLTRENEEVYNPRFLTGTLPYMSPEQTGRMNRHIDYRTDIYSLGVSFFEMLTGSVPFSSDDPMEIIHAHIAKKPPVLHEVDPDMPSVLSSIFLKTMEKTAERRYQNCFGLLWDLEECQRQWTENYKIKDFKPGSHDVSSRFKIPEKLYGHQDEIITLHETFERICKNSTTELTIILGAAGVGKSTLVNELQRPIVKERGYFLSGKFEETSQDKPYSGIISAFQELANRLISENESRILFWRELVKETLGQNAGIILDVIPELKQIIDAPPSPGDLPPEESMHRFNYTFKKFIGMFTRGSQPFVLFLDDIQWADSASLKLVNNLLIAHESRRLLIILSSRDKVPEEGVAIKPFFQELKNNGVPATYILPAPLDLSAISEMVCDTLSCTPEKAENLVALIHEKTLGNPFFARQFLNTLYQEQAIHFEASTGWSWDLKKIESIEITENVASLLTARLARLSQETGEILRMASCIGKQFQLADLVTILSRAPDQIYYRLSEALREGILQPGQGDFRFVHNRIQENLYQSLDENERSFLHYLIGKNLLKYDEEKSNSKRLFFVTDQLNMGSAHLQGEYEKYQVANLNLRAGNKASSTSALDSAAHYYRTGMSLLSSNSWEKNYEFAYQLFLKRAQYEYLTGNFTLAEDLFTQTLSHARGNLDKAAVYNTLVNLHVNLGKHDLAVEQGLKGLKLLGKKIPPAPGSWRFPVEMIISKLTMLWRKKNIERLVELPLVHEPKILKVMELLFSMGPSAYFTNQNLRNLIVFKMLNYSLKYGNSFSSPLGYMIFGMIQGSVLGNYKAGERFSRMALRLEKEQFNHPAVSGKILAIYGVLVAIWRLPLREVRSVLNRALKKCLQSGDLIYSSYSESALFFLLFYQGTTLDEIKQKIDSFLKHPKPSREKSAELTARTYLRFILNMQGETPRREDFDGPDFQEVSYLEEIQTVYQLDNMIQLYHLARMQSLYILGYYQEAILHAEKSQRLVDQGASFASLQLFDHHFYYFLILAAMYPETQGKIRRKSMALMKSRLKKIRNWARENPTNFKHKYLIMLGEFCRLKNERARAIDYFDQSIELSRQNGYFLDEALSAELSGKLLAGQKKDISAGAYIRLAHYLYLKWGGRLKALALDDLYPRFIQSDNLEYEIKDSSHETFSTSIHYDTSNLDIRTVLKATQALSSEIVLSSLLEKLMKIVLENAGATRGYMIMEKEGKLYIESQGAMDGGAHVLLESVDVESSNLVPVSIINYVKRTLKTELINRSENHKIFGSDPYIQEYKPAGVLCIPLIKSRRLRGILYLENNITPDAFTPQRQSLLKLLASQAAVSIENANLYHRIKDVNQVLTDEVGKRKEAEEHARAYSKELEDFSYSVSHDLRAPLRAVNGFAGAVLEEEGDKLSEEANLYLERILESGRTMGLLVDGLLGFIRVGRRELKPAPVDMQNLFNETLKKQLKNYPNRRVEIELGDLAPALGDHELLLQVVEHLVSNALKFTQNRELTRIEIEARRNEEEIIYSIRDNGAGFDTRFTHKLFGVFQRLHGVDEFEGIGVGLAISHRIIEKHGGRIWGESEPDAYALFRFSLPGLSDKTE